MIERTISQQLDLAAQTYQTHLALSFPAEDVKLDYISLKKNTDQVSKALLGIGLRKGDHIGIWSTNSSHWVYLALGAAQIGVVFVPINISYKSKELMYISRTTDIRFLFVMDRIRGESCVETLDCFYEESGELNWHQFPLMRDIYSMHEQPLGRLKGWNDFIACAQGITDERLEAAKELVTNQDIYIMQSTSGTTAMPKAARLYQYGVLNTANCYAQLLHLDETDVNCVPLPLFHCFGNVLTLLGGIISGSAVIYLEMFSASGMLKILMEENCTCMMGVPTMYTAMMAQPNFDKSKLSIKKAGMGGAYCPPALAESITDGFGCEGLIIGYGLSEAASLVTLSDIHDPAHNRLYTVGKPLPNFEVSLYDDATGEISQHLPQGEIVCRGFGVMKDYYKEPDETKKALDSEGWLHTGDLGAFNEDGYLRVVGRIKDIIIRGGENISPSEIEAQLLNMEEIRDVQCVGVRDKVLGEEVAAFVILKDGHSLTEDDVKAYVAAHMAKYKVPKYVFFTAGFPLNAAGKVLKRELSRIGNEKIRTM